VIGGKRKHQTQQENRRRGEAKEMIALSGKRQGGHLHFLVKREKEKKIQVRQKKERERETKRAKERGIGPFITIEVK